MSLREQQLVPIITLGNWHRVCTGPQAGTPAAMDTRGVEPSAHTHTPPALRFWPVGQGCCGAAQPRTRSAMSLREQQRPLTNWFGATHSTSGPGGWIGMHEPVFRSLYMLGPQLGGIGKGMDGWRVSPRELWQVVPSALTVVPSVQHWPVEVSKFLRQHPPPRIGK